MTFSHSILQPDDLGGGLGLETGDAEMLSQAIIADIAGAAQSIRATFRAAPRT